MSMYDSLKSKNVVLLVGYDCEEVTGEQLPHGILSGRPAWCHMA